MSANPGLRALSHFDFDSRAGVEVILVNSETSGRDLNDRVSAEFVEILVQTALAGADYFENDNIYVGRDRAWHNAIRDDPDTYVKYAMNTTDAMVLDIMTSKG